MRGRATHLLLVLRASESANGGFPPRAFRRPSAVAAGQDFALGRDGGSPKANRAPARTPGSALLLLAFFAATQGPIGNNREGPPGPLLANPEGPGENASPPQVVHLTDRDAQEGGNFLSTQEPVILRELRLARAHDVDSGEPTVTLSSALLRSDSK